MEIFQLLKTIGLHDSQAKVYLYLLANGLSTPPQVAKGTDMARPYVYGVLRSLKEMKIIETQQKGKRLAYVASDPDSLIRDFDRKRDALKHALPDLRGLYTVQKNKPSIHFFEGAQQVQEIYLQTLTAKEIYGIGSTKHLSTALKGFLTSYMKMVAKRNIVFHDILTHASADGTTHIIQETLRGLSEITLLPPEYDDMPTDILIWNDSIALISFDEPMFGTVLRNAQLAKTFRMLFSAIKGNLQKGK